MILSFFAAAATVMLRASGIRAQDVPTWSPMTQPSSPCTGSTIGWVDSFGDPCEWYEQYDVPGCPRYGDQYEGAMGTANDNCCFCAGTGAPVVTPQPIPFPTYRPTISQRPTTTPCSGSTEGWVDSSGDGCDWYEKYDVPGCPRYGDQYEGDMGTANDNCCFCAGTGAPVVTPQPIPFPTYRPTVSRAPTTPYPTGNPTITQRPTTTPCSGSTEGWVDSAGDGCDWYEKNDVPGCDQYGSEYDGGMGVAKDNCCYCRMD